MVSFTTGAVRSAILATAGLLVCIVLVIMIMNDYDYATMQMMMMTVIVCFSQTSRSVGLSWTDTLYPRGNCSVHKFVV